jgi:hypothetical protein
MRNRITLATSVERRQLRKQFCASLARSRFRTAWVIFGSSGPPSSSPLHPDHRTFRHGRLRPISAQERKFIHSMTSSARASRLGARLRPRAFADFALMASWKRVGCSMERSVGSGAFQDLIHEGGRAACVLWTAEPNSFDRARTAAAGKVPC